MLVSLEAMPQAVHLVSNNFPGYQLPDGRFLLGSGVLRRPVCLNSCSSHCYPTFHSQVSIRSVKCVSPGSSYVCKASSGGYKRNPDFSRQSRGSSRGRNRQNEERDGFENLEESDILSTKNGPFISLSSVPKSQATAAPGPREKEIVELFRKVQAQLRERAADKEEKKTESMQGQSKQNETVDSLLKLLRKHSTEQAKRNSNGSSKEFVLDQRELNGQYNRGRNSSLFDSHSDNKDESQEPTSNSTRPPSKFQRKSPIPRFKYRPIYTDEGTINLVPQVNSTGKSKQEDEMVPVSKLELDPAAEHFTEFEPEPELVQLLEDESSGTNEVHDEDDNEEEKQLIEHDDLSSLKLTELRALAKSRGLKGFSKMKKGELLEFLCTSSA